MRRAVRRAVVRLVGLVGAVVLAVAGCSSDDGGDVAPRPDPPSTAPDLWNPCDGLDGDRLSTAFGTTLDTRTGTDEAPVCSFTPQTDGEPAVDVNYQLYPGTLDDLLDSFGRLSPGAATTVGSPRVAGADDARLIVTVDDDGTLAVTAFVKNGGLVQVVNALDPAPFDRARVLRGTRVVMGGVAAHAADSGLVD